MPQDTSPYRQMELGASRGGMEHLSQEQMREQMESARRQAEFYESQRAEWEKQQAELQENAEFRKQFEQELNRIGMKLHNATMRMEGEMESIERERRIISQIHACLKRHLEILSSIRPETWPQESFPKHLDEALPKLERAENDFHEAYYGADHYRHTALFLDKPGEERKSEFNWTVLRLELAKGLAFHLPLFLLLLLTWLIYLAATTF